MTGTPLPGVDELYDAAPCGLLVAGPGGVLLHANATICRWLRYERGELVDKLRLQDLMSTGARIFFHTHLQPLLRMQGSVSEVKLDIRHIAPGELDRAGGGHDELLQGAADGGLARARLAH